ncbi:MAG: mechanosensitive ion channel [Halioglobus sp.]|nr:mechanosensitive ion channel [Halioglobus sp.]
MAKRLWRYRESRNPWRSATILSPVITCAFMLCVLLQAVPLYAQDGPDLTSDLVDQRIALLRAEGVADSEEPLKTYRAIVLWLASTQLHRNDAARYIEELTEAPRREAEIQARLDSMSSAHDSNEDISAMSVQELEAELLLTQSATRDARVVRDILARQLAARESKRDAIRDRLDEIALRLDAMTTYGGTVDPNAAPSFAEASQWLVRAEQASLREERLALSAQLDSQPVRYSAMNVERAELQGKIDALVQRTNLLSKRLQEVLLSTSTQDALSLASDSPIYELAQEYHEKNVILREQLLELELELTNLVAERQVLRRKNRMLNESFISAKRVVEFAHESEDLGGALVGYWEELNRQRLQETREGIPRQVGDSVVSRIHHEESVADMVSATAYLDTTMRDAGLNPTRLSHAERETLLTILLAKRELLRSIISIESDVIDMLSELQVNYEEYEGTIAEYKRFLDPLVLWLPSGSRLWKAEFSDLPEELEVLLEAGKSVELALQPRFFGFIVLALVLLLLKSRLRDYQHRQNDLISRPRDSSIHFTALALGATALRALPIALLVAALASLTSTDKHILSVALTIVLYSVAAWLFTAKLLGILCENDGVARKHFQWREQLCDRLRLESQWFLRWLLPALAVSAVLYRLHGTVPLLGRLAMLAITLWTALHIARALTRAAKAGGREVLANSNFRFELILALFFFAAAAGVVFGLRLSVIFVINTVLDTLQAGIALAIAYSFLLRWLKVERRRLRFEELLRARGAQSEQPLSEMGVVEEAKENLADLGEETKQLLNAAAIVVALSMLYFLWAPILPVFNAMSAITLWTSTVMVEGQPMTNRITLEIVVFVVLVLGVTVYAARKLPALVELVLRSRRDVSAGTRYTVSTLLNYIILGGGILFALSRLGLDWSKLQWLVAALGVGIGFGLQEVVANFICGLIILFERPISVGDIITVGDQDGVVTKIRIRATTIRDWDNKELLIPNKEIITGRLLNWSLTDTRLRLTLPVGVAYGSDAVLALKILADTVADDDRILADPAPSIIFSDFGESSLNMVCRFYIDNVDNMWPVKTALHLEIYRRFEEAGIVISFPQHDVHLDSEKPLRISLDPGPAT